MPTVADEAEIARLKRENALLRAAAMVLPKVDDKPPGEQSTITAVLRHGAKILRSTMGHGSAAVEVNAPEDVKYAHQAAAFSGVVHVFHREWIGIRAAAGSLPGNKIAISAKGRMSQSDVASFLAALNELKSERYVFHGMSANAAMLIGELAKVGLSPRVYLVYHGNVSQWYHKHERDLAFSAIDLARAGHVKRIHFMRKNYDLVEGRSFLPMLLNMYPNVPTAAVGNSRADGTVFVPGTDDWRKNLHCNALGASLSDRISSVIHFARNIELPFPHAGKLKYVHFVDRSSTFDLMALCACVLNVSLVECHPMVNLESEAVGTPCLRGPLNLDTLEEHPYVGLVQVTDPTSPFEIRNVLERTLSVPRAELHDMIRDYSRLVNKVSVERYREFLEI